MTTFLRCFFPVVTLLFSWHACAEKIIVSPQDNLQMVLDAADDGDSIELMAGKYSGNFIINHAITLTAKRPSGSPVIIDAQGQGNALFVASSHVQINQLTITHWGHDLSENNAGVFATARAHNLQLSNNKLRGNGVGIWLQGLEHAVVVNNIIEGNTDFSFAERGNGIELSTVKNSLILRNDIFNVRDGIYVSSSEKNTIKENTLHHLRYGVHYMYSHDDQVLNNVAYQTRAGFALMSSRDLLVRGNRDYDSEDYGFLLNFITACVITGNEIKKELSGNKAKDKSVNRAHKGFFIYHSSNNRITDNLIQSGDIGIHLTAGSDANKVYGNSFIDIPTPVKSVVNKSQEWSEKQDGVQRGNYWNRYLGWDLNRDGIGDIAYEPNDGIDKLAWQYPEMKMLMDSPAVLILRWVQRHFPLFKPPGVIDSFPLMQSPHNITTPLFTLPIIRSQEAL